MTTVAVIGAGAMGAGVATRLHENGCQVLTLLGGRSAASRRRAEAAGMRDASLEQVGRSDVILSIVPPAQAGAVVERLAPALGEGVLLCDANAVNPETKRRLARRVQGLGGRLVDGAIIGGPPAGDDAGPRLYLAGDGADEVAALRAFGLDTRVLGGPFGAAAALKMCYGGLNKGVIGLATAILLAARRHGAAEDLVAEMGDSLPWLLERLPRSVPSMYAKAYRWDAEMHEVAGFLAPDDLAGAAVWDGLGDFYTDRAAAAPTGEELAELRRLLGPG
jgi:3-hydroxyisobutyrate dehydrogenase-like beta-hydroxyacid dehydrogenase